MNKLLLFTTSWMPGTATYVDTIKKVSDSLGLPFDHYDSEVNASQSLVMIFSIKSAPTLVLLNDSTGDFKKLSMIHTADEVISFINANKDLL